MEHRVFVSGTLLRGEVNHHLLSTARFLGEHRTQARFRLLLLGAYPGLIAGGDTAVQGEFYALCSVGLCRLDPLEDYPRLYDRRLMPRAHGSAWVYLYRGPRRDRQRLVQGNWRGDSRGARRAAVVRSRRDPKNPSHRRRLGCRG